MDAPEDPRIATIDDARPVAPATGQDGPRPVPERRHAVGDAGGTCG